MVKASQLNQEIAAALHSRKSSPSRTQQLDREIKTALNAPGFSGSPRPWSLAFDARPFLKRIEAHKRAETSHRKRIETLESQMAQLHTQIPAASPRQQVTKRRKLASISGKILEHRAAISTAKAARSQAAKDLELARSSQVWERKIEAAKRREAGIVATREGIAVVGRRIGTDPRAVGPSVSSTAEPRHYAETPDFRIGGPGSMIREDPASAVPPRGTTSIWRPLDEERHQARLERERREQRARPTKTQEEWYEHDLRLARERQPGALPARYEEHARSELPVATARGSSTHARARAFLRGLLPRRGG